MIRQKNAWTCIPATGYNFPMTTSTTTTTAMATTQNSHTDPRDGSANNDGDGGDEGTGDDLDRDLKQLLDKGESKEQDDHNPIDVDQTTTTITIQYRHYEARLPIGPHPPPSLTGATVHDATGACHNRNTVITAGHQRLARLSAVVAESEWKASHDDWASMRVVPEPSKKNGGGGGGIYSNNDDNGETRQLPPGPATQKRLEVRNQKQIQKLQRRGSMTMKLVHKGKKALSKQARKAKIQERAKKAANILTSSNIFKQLVDTAYIHCCEAAADYAQQHTSNNNSQQNYQIPQSIKVPSKASMKKQGSRDLNSSFRSLLGGGGGGSGVGPYKQPTEEELHRQRLAAEGHIGPTELYAGLLWVHVQLARYLGVAALYPPDRSVVYDLFLISDVDDSGGIDREEFNLIAKTTCAQIMGRLGVVYLARFIVFPILSQWLIMYFLPFSSLLPRVVHTVLEQAVSSFLFLILIPVWFGIIDEQSCVSAERKASKAIEKRKKREMQRELKRLQSSNSSGRYASTAVGPGPEGSVLADHHTVTSTSVAVSRDVSGAQEESNDVVDTENEDGVGDVTEIEVMMECPRPGINSVTSTEKMDNDCATCTGTVQDADLPQRSIPRNQSFFSTSSNEGSIDIDQANLEAVGSNHDRDDDDDEEDEEESDIDDSLDEEEYEDSSDEDDVGDFDSDDDGGVETSSRGYMSIHSRPTPDSSNSDMSTHHSGDLAASSGNFDPDDDILEPSEREGKDDDSNDVQDERGVFDALAMKPLFRQNSRGEYYSESSSVDDDDIDEDSLGFDADEPAGTQNTCPSIQDENDTIDKPCWEKKTD